MLVLGQLEGETGWKGKGRLPTEDKGLKGVGGRVSFSGASVGGITVGERGEAEQDSSEGRRGR